MQTSKPDPCLERIQAAAESEREDASLPLRELRAYRAVYRAVRAAPLPRPPVDFARTLAALMADAPERATVEIWLMRLLFAGLLLGGAAWLGLVAAESGALAAARVQRFAPPFVAVLTALLSALLVDALLARRHHRRPPSPQA